MIHKSAASGSQASQEHQFTWEDLQIHVFFLLVLAVKNTLLWVSSFSQNVSHRGRFFPVKKNRKTELWSCKKTLDGHLVHWDRTWSGDGHRMRATNRRQITFFFKWGSCFYCISARSLSKPRVRGLSAVLLEAAGGQSRMKSVQAESRSGNETLFALLQLHTHIQKPNNRLRVACRHTRAHTHTLMRRPAMDMELRQWQIEWLWSGCWAGC